MGFATSALAAPVNDNFENRIALGSGTVTSGFVATTDGTRQVDEPPVFDAGTLTLWWTWTASQTGEVRMSTAGSAINTTLCVFTGNSLDTLEKVARNGDAVGTLRSEVVFQAAAGDVFQIMVAPKNGLTGASAKGNVRVAVTFTPGGYPGVTGTDDFDLRPTATDAFWVGRAETSNAEGAETGEPTHGPGAGSSFWWEWRPTFDGLATLRATRSTRSDEPGAGNTLLWVYAGSELNTLHRVVYNDDAPGSVGSLATFQARAGEVYQIMVASQGPRLNLVMDVSLEANGQPGAHVMTDLFADRPRTTGAHVRGVGNTRDAGTVTGEPRPWAGAPTLWLEWSAPSDGNLVLSTAGSDRLDDGNPFNTVMAVYSGTEMTALTHLQENDNQPGLVTSYIAMPVTHGTVYQILVTQANGLSSAGNIRLALDFEPVLEPPTITTAPTAQRVSIGSNVLLRVEAGGSGPLQYQWRRDGVAVSGANASTLSLLGLTQDQQGSYDVVITNAAGTITTTPVAVSSGRLVNVSTRGCVGHGSAVLIPGFVVEGGSRTLLIRAVGPRLSGFGVEGVLVDPKISVVPRGGSLPVATNDDWASSPDAAAVATAFGVVGAFPLTGSPTLPDDTKSAALLVTLPPGGYTVVVEGADGGEGIVLAEVYEMP